MRLTLRRQCFLILPLLLLLKTAFPQSSGYHARYYPNASPFFEGYEETATPDSGIAIAGVVDAAFNQDASNLMVMKLDGYGKALWGRSINTGAGMGYGDPSICALSDGSIAVAVQLEYSTPTYYADMFVVKLDCQGKVIWSRLLTMNASIGQKVLQAMSLKEGANGDLLLSFFCYSINPFSVVSRIDAGGNLVWSKTFYAAPANSNNSPVGSTHYTAAAFYQDKQVYVFGFKNEYENAINYFRQQYAMLLDYSNGAVIKQQSYSYNEPFTGNWGVVVGANKMHFNAQQLEDGNFALFGMFANFSQTNAFLYRLIINKDLSVNQAQAFAVPKAMGIDDRMNIRVMPNGQTHIATIDYDNNNYYWYAADKAGNVIRQVEIPYAPMSMDIYGGYVFQTGPARTAYVANLFKNGQVYMDVTQVEDGSHSTDACLGAPTPSFVQPQSWQVNTGSWNWLGTGNNEVVATMLPDNSAGLVMNTSFLCAPNPPANAGFKMIGPAAACVGGAPYAFHVSTNRATYKPVHWTMDPALYQSLTTVNDSTLDVVFRSPGGGPYTAKLYATAPSSCLPVEDSVSITVYPDAQLPRDATICTQPIVLHPGYWFDSYLWQDGFTDSVYAITKPGTYILNLETYCGTREMDTVEVYKDRIGGLGPATICASDTATLLAPGGFINYSWGPDYHLIPVNDTAVKVYPSADTAYILSSATPDGCALKDTIIVHVRPSPVVRLGNDTVICQNDQLQLNAGRGYKSYAWNTGETSATLVASQPGVYAVLVMDDIGCRGGDTIQIAGKYCPDEIAFPTGFSPDGNGYNDLFKPHIEGRMDDYQFIVYNRWGVTVFSTNDPARGWDGKYNGVLQLSGTYAWICRYKFADQGKKTAHGTVELVR